MSGDVIYGTVNKSTNQQIIVEMINHRQIWDGTIGNTIASGVLYFDAVPSSPGCVCMAWHVMRLASGLATTSYPKPKPEGLRLSGAVNCWKVRCGCIIVIARLEFTL